MRLSTREWGEGNRHAVLIHGVMSAADAWHRVGPALAERGYRVVAVDLPGHGRSPRLPRYTIDDLAEGILESVPYAPEVAIGHSLGGFTLSRLVGRLEPAHAVYVDPAFSGPALPRWLRALAPLAFRRLLASSARRIARSNPRWEAADVEIEHRSFRAFDRAMIPLILEPGLFRAPERAAVPSLVLLADPSRLVPPPLADELRSRGFEVRTVAGTTHTIDRDDFAGFMAGLAGWI